MEDGWFVFVEIGQTASNITSELYALEPGWLERADQLVQVSIGHKLSNEVDISRLQARAQEQHNVGVPQLTVKESRGEGESLGY
jgi:hypothetical protein